MADGSNWRESVNASNPIYTVVSVNGAELNLSSIVPVSHNRSLDIKTGIHSRKTVFSIDGVNVTVKAERFVSMAKENIICLKYSVVADKDVSITVKTGIDKNIWDISGKHLNYVGETADNNYLELNSETVQLKNKLKVCETIIGLDNITNENLLHISNINLKANEEFELSKFAAFWDIGMFMLPFFQFADVNVTKIITLTVRVIRCITSDMC